MAGETEKLNGNIIADVSIRQPVFITMLMLLAVVIGILAYTTLPVNLLPDIDIPTVAVSISYPGAGPESMVDQVAKPVEDQIITINGVKHITSNSNEGFAVFIIEFQSDISVDRALQDVRDKVNAVMPSLPQDVQDPVFQKFDPNQQPILTVALSSKSGMPPLELRRLIDDQIAPRIQQAPGVGSVSVSGGEVRQINVLMDLEKLKAWKILPAQITNSIRNANANLGLGNITTGTRDINLRAPSMIQSPQDIGRIQITNTKYHISDVTTIEDGVAEVKQYARLDGKDAISLDIRRQSGTNVVAVAGAAKAQLESLAKDYPDLSYFIPRDDSEAVQESVNAAIDELLVASVAAMLVVLVFFRDIRNTLVTVAGLPVILISTFAALKLFGLTINLISLLALSVSVGLVIDDAIVVRENIFRQMERGLSPRAASSRGTAQVALSVLAMSLTIIAVFLPVTFSGGITGIIFSSFGITVACSMAISLFEAFTLAPMLSAYFFKQKHVENAVALTDEVDEHEELLDEANEDPGAMGRVYQRILAWSLRHRLVIVGITLGVFVLSGVVASTLKFSFFPTQDEGVIAVAFQAPPGTPLAQTDKLARQAEAILLKDPAVEAVQTSVGAGSSEQGSFFVKLHKGEKTSVVSDRLRPQLSFLPTFIVGKTGMTGTTTDISGRDIQLSVQSSRTPEELLPLLQQLQKDASGIAGLTDLDTTFKPGKPEILIHVDPSRVGDLGYTNQDIANSVRSLISGDTATTFRKDGQDTDIVVRLKPSDRTGVGQIQQISVPTASGSVPLASIARVEVSSSATTIRRYDRLNQVLIGANVSGRNANDVQAEIQAGLDRYQLPSDVQITFVGFAQSQNEGFQTLLIAMGLSVLFVYMVLASQFGSFLQPFVIMLAMPFSFIGGFLALRMRDMDLSIIGMIGLIMLLGLVVKNSILMVDFTNRLRRAGMEKHRALELAGAIRLRPILMTTFALVAGSIPSAIGLGEGAEIRSGLSTVVIGGLLTSVVLTLLVIPTAYSLLESFTSRATRLFRRRPKATPSSGPASSSEHTSVVTTSDGQPVVATTVDGVTVQNGRPEQDKDAHPLHTDLS